MKIQILENYGGVKTNEKRILPGVYEMGDPRLFGVEDYLIEKGVAIAVDDTIALTDFTYTRPKDDVRFHNDLMQKKGRSTIPTEEENDNPPIPDVSVEEIEREALTIEYVRLFGKPPHHNAKNETIRQKIAEKENDTPDIHG